MPFSTSPAPDRRSIESCQDRAAPAESGGPPLDRAACGRFPRLLHDGHASRYFPSSEDTSRTCSSFFFEAILYRKYKLVARRKLVNLESTAAHHRHHLAVRR